MTYTTIDLIEALFYYEYHNENADIRQEAIEGDETAAEMLVVNYKTEIANKNFKGKLCLIK